MVWGESQQFRINALTSSAGEHLMRARDAVELTDVDVKTQRVAMACFSAAYDIARTVLNHIALSVMPIERQEKMQIYQAVEKICFTFMLVVQGLGSRYFQFADVDHLLYREAEGWKEETEDVRCQFTEGKFATGDDVDLVKGGVKPFHHPEFNIKTDGKAFLERHQGTLQRDLMRRDYEFQFYDKDLNVTSLSMPKSAHVERVKAICKERRVEYNESPGNGDLAAIKEEVTKEVAEELVKMMDESIRSCYPGLSEKEYLLRKLTLLFELHQGGTQTVAVTMLKGVNEKVEELHSVGRLEESTLFPLHGKKSEVVTLSIEHGKMQIKGFLTQEYGYEGDVGSSEGRATPPARLSSTVVYTKRHIFDDKMRLHTNQLFTTGS